MVQVQHALPIPQRWQITWGTFILIATGVFWYRAAQVENVSAVYWVSLSILFNLAAQWLVGTYTAMLVSQVLLFVLITAWRAMRST